MSWPPEEPTPRARQSRRHARNMNWFYEYDFKMRIMSPRAVLPLPHDPGWLAPLRREVGNALVLAAAVFQLADYDLPLACTAYSAAVTMGIVFE